MDRDMRLIQRKRIEKDRANGLILTASPEKGLNKSDMGETGDLTEEMVMDKPELPTTEPDQPAHPADTDLELGAHGNAQIETASGEAAINGLDDALATNQGMPQDSEHSIGLAISMPSGEATKNLDQPVETEAGTSDPTAIAQTSLDLADGGVIDFESMFNDTDLAAADDSLNFDDVEFSTDPAMTQAILNNNNFANIAISTTDIPNLPATTNEDIDSLLPGVESYLNADTDFSSLDIPPSSTLPETSQAAVVNTTGAPEHEANGAPAPDATFADNIFGFDDFDKGGADGDDLQDVNFDDFDWN